MLTSWVGGSRRKCRKYILGGVADNNLYVIPYAPKIAKDDREVESTVCKRATQRLAEYEKMLEELSQRRSNALVHNETQQAERILMAMTDCRDTVLRAIHVDLLLGRDELRAIGIDSEWADDKE
ncbi:hypothetical protein ANCCEY_13799 [Ancylostoma ceylanicum]|uniref:Uncharacterized protein n=1 Tax=Ancylostoma ceylanicum TaxID=53326 RepID=A0A0D6L6P5_9BILA|nr:hypothetical protein ANCCEY_13799 [Ancylostoma ceylanicum]